MNSLRAIGLIAKSVWIEAIRRKEIYAIVIACVALIGVVMTLDFFELEGLTKFYREVALKVMSAATAITVVVLAARQLPREFETRTIYPLLARPISRPVFLLGKLAGVMGAAAFCFALFMAVYLFGTLFLGGAIPWALFLEFIYLQLVMMMILATLSFWLSMLFHLDATIVIGILFYGIAATLTTMMTYLYDYSTVAGKWMFAVLNYVVPQLVLFDLSDKAVHDEMWGPLGLGTMLQLSLYGLVFAGAYFSAAAYCFQRRAL